MAAAQTRRAPELVVLGALVSAVLSVAVVSTLGAPLIPAVARAHGVSLADAQWILTIALVTGAVATPALGRLGDIASSRRVLLLTLTATALGALVSALADSFALLLVGRAVQGVGYGVLPLTFTLASRHISGRTLQIGVALLAVTVATGVGLGNPLTGLLAHLYSTSAAYWLGVAMSTFAVVAVWLAVPAGRGRRGGDRARFDAVGAALLGAGLAIALVAVTEAPARGWTSLFTVTLLALAVVLLCAWPAAELRHPQPLVDVRLMAQPTVAVCNTMAVLVGFGMYAGLSLVNRYAQAPDGFGLGATPLQGGFLLAPLALGSLLATPVRTWAGDRWGLQRVLIGGAVLEAVTLSALVVAHDQLYQLLIAVTLFGLGVGCSFAVMPALIMAVAPPSRTGSTTSLNQVLRMVGGALGSAISVTVLELHTAAGAIEATEAGYAVAFGLAGAMCAAAALVGAAGGRFPRSARAEPRVEDYVV